MPQAVTTCSGVPQGMCWDLFCLMFVVKISTKKCLFTMNCNDIYLYADDTKLFRSDAFELHANINIVECFTSSRQLFLAPSKRYHLAISRK